MASSPPIPTNISEASSLDPEFVSFLQQTAQRVFIAEDLVALTRMVYVHVLLRARQSSGGRRMSRQLILGFTGWVLTRMVGFYLDEADVANLLDETDGVVGDPEKSDDPMEERRKRLAAAKQKTSD